jgi:hypothetical protein
MGAYALIMAYHFGIIHAKAPIKQACKLVFSRAAGAQRANARSGGM